MIKFEGRGDIFRTTAQTLVNPVNVVGVMGAGLALEFKRRDPALFKAYQELCAQQAFQATPVFVRDFEARKCLLFPTKEHWRDPGIKDLIIRGLKYTAENYEALGITSLAIPKVGCGRGDLDWREIRPEVMRYFSGIELPVYIYL